MIPLVFHTCHCTWIADMTAEEKQYKTTANDVMIP